MAALSGEIVTPEDDSLEEDGREFVPFPFGQHEIHIAEPKPGQMLIVLAMLDLQDETNDRIKIEGLNNFGVVIRSLFTRDSDRQKVMRALAAGELELEEYFELALAMIREWAPEQLGNRESRRAATKAAPAKRAARAVRGGRR